MTLINYIEILRGHAAMGIGEGPNQKIRQGEQYIKATSPFDQSEAFLQALRPWMTLDATTTDHARLGAYLEAWSYVPISNYRIVIRLGDAGIYDRRPAYLSHGLGFPKDYFETVDPGCLLGHPTIYKNELGTQSPTKLTYQDLSLPKIKSENKKLAISVAAHFFYAQLNKIQLGWAIPFKQFSYDSPLVSIVTLARSILPHSKRRDCRIRVFTTNPAAFFERNADLVVFNEDLLSTFRPPANRQILLLDREGRTDVTIPKEYIQYASKLFDAVSDEPRALTSFVKAAERTLGNPEDLGRHIRGIDLLYNIALTDDTNAEEAGYLAQGIMDQARHGLPIPLPLLMTPQDWHRTQKRDIISALLHTSSGYTHPDQLVVARTLLHQLTTASNSFSMSNDLYQRLLAQKGSKTIRDLLQLKEIEKVFAPNQIQVIAEGLSIADLPPFILLERLQKEYETHNEFPTFVSHASTLGKKAAEHPDIFGFFENHIGKLDEEEETFLKEYVQHKKDLNSLSKFLPDFLAKKQSSWTRCWHIYLKRLLAATSIQPNARNRLKTIKPQDIQTGHLCDFVQIFHRHYDADQIQSYMHEIRSRIDKRAQDDYVELTIFYINYQIESSNELDLDLIFSGDTPLLKEKPHISLKRAISAADRQAEKQPAEFAKELILQKVPWTQWIEFSKLQPTHKATLAIEWLASPRPDSSRPSISEWLDVAKTFTEETEYIDAESFAKIARIEHRDSPISQEVIERESQWMWLPPFDFEQIRALSSLIRSTEAAILVARLWAKLIWSNSTDGKYTYEYLTLKCLGEIAGQTKHLKKRSTFLQLKTCKVDVIKEPSGLRNLLPEDLRSALEEAQVAPVLNALFKRPTDLPPQHIGEIIHAFNIHKKYKFADNIRAQIEIEWRGIEYYTKKRIALHIEDSLKEAGVTPKNLNRSRTRTCKKLYQNGLKCTATLLAKKHFEKQKFPRRTQPPIVPSRNDGPSPRVPQQPSMLKELPYYIINQDIDSANSTLTHLCEAATKKAESSPAKEQLDRHPLSQLALDLRKGHNVHQISESMLTRCFSKRSHVFLAYDLPQKNLPIIESYHSVWDSTKPWEKVLDRILDLVPDGGSKARRYIRDEKWWIFCLNTTAQYSCAQNKEAYFAYLQCYLIPKVNPFGHIATTSLEDAFRHLLSELS